MAYIIVQAICIQCGSCAPFCKNEAIDWIDHQYHIHPERCEMCGTCLTYCPMDDAIVEDSAQGSSLAQLHVVPQNH